MAEIGYDAKDITVLEGLEAVRLRPGMYIGTTGSPGLHHLVYEVVDNSVDEALQGRCDHIVVTILPGDVVTVEDNGSGIPVAVMDSVGLPAVEVVLTKLHAGGKFGGSGYKVSGGLHGVGISVVNALSDHLRVAVKRDGYVWTQLYERGDPMGPLERGEATDEHGTTIEFHPDPEIFEETDFSFDTLAQRMREMAFLTKGLRIELIDDRAGGQRADFQFEGGIRDFIAYVNQNKDPIHPDVIYFENETPEGEVEVAMQWNSSYVESTFSFANNINTHEGGTHLSGFKAALTRTLNDYARNKGAAEGQGRAADRRRLPRGPGCDRVGEAARPAVRGPDQDQARQPVHPRARGDDVQRQAVGVSRGASQRGAGSHQQADRGEPCPSGGP